MHKLSLLLLLATLLAGCAGQPAAPSSAVAPTSTASVETGASSQPSCTSVAAEPTPDPAIASLFPPVGVGDHILGSENAPVTITVYSDFQCTACAATAATLTQLVEESGGKIRLIFRHNPQAATYDKSLLAAQAAEAAAEQSKFWEVHDFLFQSQAEWSGLAPDAFKTWLIEKAAATGLDKDAFATDLERPDIIARVKEADDFGANTGLVVAPFMLINGQQYFGPQDASSLGDIAGVIELGERQFKTCPEQVIDPAKDYTATLHTEKGDIVIQLFADKAPATVNSFVFLAQHGWFDNITWHRVLPGFVAQTGDPTGTGMGGPGYYINNEVDPSLTYDREGLVGMANSGPDTNGSQFFITLGPAPHLNGQYTIFGEVIEGMEVVKSLSQRNPQPGQTLPPGDKLLNVTIEEK